MREAAGSNTELMDENEQRLKVLLPLANDDAECGLLVLVAGDPRFEIVGETTVAVVGKAEEFRPDLIVLDPELHGRFDLEPIATLAQDVPESNICVYTKHADAESVLAAGDAGARGYLLKGRMCCACLLDALSTVAGGGIALDPSIYPLFHGASAAHLLLTPRDADLPILADRERGVLHGLAAAKSRSRIASELNVSEETVKRDIQALIQTIGGPNREVMLIRAALLGLAHPPPREPDGSSR